MNFNMHVILQLDKSSNISIEKGWIYTNLQNYKEIVFIIIRIESRCIISKSKTQSNGKFQVYYMSTKTNFNLI